jgi:hypothetical protein
MASSFELLEFARSVMTARRSPADPVHQPDQTTQVSNRSRPRAEKSAGAAAHVRPFRGINLAG